MIDTIENSQKWLFFLQGVTGCKDLSLGIPLRNFIGSITGLLSEIITSLSVFGPFVTKHPNQTLRVCDQIMPFCCPKTVLFSR